jgi:hypothetical protein
VLCLSVDDLFKIATGARIRIRKVPHCVDHLGYASGILEDTM